ncbi:MAG: hypothetical protein COW00_06850 [Bdellovibrio sp. CG12_big_fil_rev_8_21_14_0_65_39_13]|nr:MAG: hypothetical protein COW78_02975 [Bdellovibrio sp. CG22_combo_CG10-13_8_21_14_all_39_27]PIQ60324.1 MAG: hypothetical protein COW00_06850 [Bdellovibrio sp. CG12_big_fil_rev_8_21_14_0_65_39_13]PIR35067.1 MAG: hypothetical protein COV37_10610 [Bdellovibrio sp. CG11_big_fil_rev_8_21_14_0_20_39_38]
MKIFIVLVTLFTLNFSQAANLPCEGEKGDYFVNANGEPGGFVAENAIVDTTVYLGKNVQICGHAMILDHAQITGNAIVKDYAKVYHSAKVFGNAIVYENAEIYERAGVWENARAYGNSRIYGFAGLRGNVRVYGVARMYDATYSSGVYY